MLIENAERFGLAQLHQLRGPDRSRRTQIVLHFAELQSDEETSAKLAVLERTRTGLKSPKRTGNYAARVICSAQRKAACPALKIGDLKRDADLMRRRRAAAMSIFEMDPRLELPENQRFRRLIVEQQGQSFSHVS
jgi:ATP-dependent DNA helicase RecG